MQLTRFKKLLFIAFFVAIAFAVMSNATETAATTTKNESPSDVESSPDDEAHHDGPLISRVKRQWGCPQNCYGSCSSNVQCRRYNVRSVCVSGCCCGSSTNISSK